MRQLAIFSKILPFVMIASLLSLSLASLTEELGITSMDDAIHGGSFIVNDNGTTEDCPLKTEPRMPFNLDLVPAEELRLHGDRQQPPVKPPTAVPYLKEILSEIFIPPEIVT